MLLQTYLVRQLVAQHRQTGGDPARHARGSEGHPDSETLHQVVHPVPQYYHPGRAGDCAWRRRSVGEPVAVTSCSYSNTFSLFHSGIAIFLHFKVKLNFALGHIHNLLPILHPGHFLLSSLKVCRSTPSLPQLTDQSLQQEEADEGGGSSEAEPHRPPVAVLVLNQ